MAGTFVDFAALKEAVSISQVVDMLGLKMKGNDQMRSSCPACRSGGDRALAVNISKSSFYCFGCSGDKSEPQKQPATTGGMTPLDYLEHEHDAVQVLGFDAETAKALGIGFAGKGLMRGTVAVPVRLEDGTLAGYIGLTEIERLPPKWQLPINNVVALKKPA